MPAWPTLQFAPQEELARRFREELPGWGPGRPSCVLPIADHTYAAYAVAKWGYWREIAHREIAEGYWCRNLQATWCAWFVDVPGHPGWVGFHCALAPGHRPPKDWTALVRQVAVSLQAQRVLVYIPEEAQELHWRALRRYLQCRGWAHSPLGPVLEV